MIEVGYWWGTGHSESVHAITNETKERVLMGLTVN